MKSWNHQSGRGGWMDGWIAMDLCINLSSNQGINQSLTMYCLVHHNTFYAIYLFPPNPASSRFHSYCWPRVQIRRRLFLNVVKMRSHRTVPVGKVRWAMIHASSALKLTTEKERVEKLLQWRSARQSASSRATCPWGSCGSCAASASSCATAHHPFAFFPPSCSCPFVWHYMPSRRWCDERRSSIQAQDPPVRSPRFHRLMWLSTFKSCSKRATDNLLFPFLACVYNVTLFQWPATSFLLLTRNMQTHLAVIAQPTWRKRHSRFHWCWKLLHCMER